MGTAGRRRGAPPGQLGWSRPDRPGPGHRGQAARPDSNVLSIDLLSRVAHIPLAQYSPVPNCGVRYSRVSVA